MEKGIDCRAGTTNNMDKQTLQQQRQEIAATVADFAPQSLLRDEDDRESECGFENDMTLH